MIRILIFEFDPAIKTILESKKWRLEVTYSVSFIATFITTMISTKMLIAKKYHISSILPFRFIILVLCIIFCIIHTYVVSSLSPTLIRRSYVNNGLCHSTSIFQPNTFNCDVNRRSYFSCLQRRKNSAISKTILYDSISKVWEWINDFYYTKLLLII